MIRAQSCVCGLINCLKVASVGITLLWFTANGPKSVKSILQSKLHLCCGIVQAPMAGGPTTPALVAAVTAAGALGSFGFAYSSAAQIGAQCQEFRDLCDGQGLQSDCGWNANFFVFPEIAEPEQAIVVEAAKNLEALARRVDIDVDSLTHDTHLPKLGDQVDAALAYKPSLVSFHLGIPAKNIIDSIHEAGCLIAMSATSLTEATTVQASGADFIVAQGYEAGGHRGIFDPGIDDDKLGTRDLVKIISENCNTPVIAAGGIMNGSDINAAIACGADAVQLGSAFLTVDECGSRDIYRAAIDSIGDRDTQFTTGFSGRPARGISNLFIDSIGNAVLPFPLQNSLTGALRKAAGSRGDIELMSLWAGTEFSKARYCTAAELIETLQREAGNSPGI